MFNKNAFDELAGKFGEYLKKDDPILPYWYTAQKVFQENWNTSILDITKMIDQALDESSGKWSLPLNDAKSVQLRFSKLNSDLLISNWKDLVNENKSLDGRIDRFLFHMDLLLSETNSSRIILPDHHHDKYIVSIYLCFFTPTLYFPFEYRLFRKGMKKMKALSIPEDYEIDRYYKIGRIITKFLVKTDNVKQYYIDKSTCHFPDNQLIAYDFLKFLEK